MKKSLSTKWKVIIFCMAIIVAMTSTGFTVWAIARNYFRYNADFEVNITGGRYVNASITGASYVAGSGTSYETLDTATFNGETENETSTLAFKNPITMQNDEQVSKLRFEITNNSPYSNHNDLIIKPSITTEDIDDVIISWYYSTDDVTYFAYAEEYLVAHKGNTLYVELRMLATQNLFGNVSFEDSVSIDMYSEMDPPTDFAYEYDYEYDETTLTATKTQICPTCDLCAHSYTTETMDESEYIVADGNTYSGSSEKVSNKVIFLEGENQYNITFSCELENVVLCQPNNSTTLIDSLTLEVLSNDRSSIFNNLTFVGLNFANNTINVTPHASFEGSIADFTLMSNIKFINCSIAYNIFQFTAFDTIIDNLLIKNCALGSYGDPMDSTAYTVSDINNLVYENNNIYNATNIVFENVNNLVIKNNFTDLVSPSFKSISGDIYIVNNGEGVYYNFTETTTNAKFFIKNNHIELRYATEFVTIVSPINTVIESCDNSIDGQDRTPYKFNQGTSSATIEIKWYC